MQSDVATLNILQSQFEGWKKELQSDLETSRRSMTDLIREEGERGQILMNRINFFNFYTLTLFGDHQLEQEWKNTKRLASLHRSKDLEADLLELVNETA